MATQQQRARRRRQRQRRAARNRSSNPQPLINRRRRPGGIDMYLAARARPINKAAVVRPQRTPRVQTMFEAPAAIGTLRRSTAPIFNGMNTIRIQHREYLCNTEFTDLDEFPSVSALAVRTYPINPGQYGTCPWLSPIAAQFEEYRFLGLKLEYRSCVGSDVTGFTYLSVDYDSSDGPPLNKQMIDSLEGTQSCSTWVNFDMPCDPVQLRGMLGGWRYVRPGTQPPNTDIKLYDSGFLIVGTSDRSSDSRETRGDVWISYDVEFRKPQTDVFETAKTISKKVQSFGTPTELNPWTGNPSYSGQLAVEVVEGMGGINALQFNQPGSYLMTNLLSGTGLSGNQLTSEIPAGYVGSVNPMYSYLSGTTVENSAYLIEAISVPFKAIFTWDGTNTTKTFLTSLLSTYNAGAL